MDTFVDINQIQYQDFDTPRNRSHQENNPHLNSSYLGYSPSHNPSPIMHTRLSQELSQNEHHYINPNQPGESKRTTKMRSITDKWLRSFSLSRNLSEDEQNAQLLANIRHEQDSEENNLEQNSLAKKYSTLGVNQNLSPLGIPFQPFAHTKTNFHARARQTLGMEQQSSQKILNSSIINQKNQIEGNNLMRVEQQQQIMLNNDAGLRKYDEKIRDVSNTLAKLREYKSQLTTIEQQQKFRTQKKRAKSSLSNCSGTNTLSSDTPRRLPMINQQPMMYFSPFEPAHSQQSPSTKKRKTKKPKQAGINELAQNILSGLPQEKIANLMAVNMYNKALLKKEENEDKITTVISEQNKLLAKMLDQYDKRVHDTRKQVKLNLGRLQAESSQESKFERDKRNFEKVYSDIQQRFTREQATLERLPRNDENTPSYYKTNTKQLRYIPTHYKKYKPVPETKVQQPPMIF